MTPTPPLTAARLAAAALGLALLAGCEPVPAANVPGSTIPTGPYVLVSLGPDTVPQRNFGLTIAADGSISGQAPCNHYAAAQTAQPPAFRIAGLTTSGQPCGGLNGRMEQRYFQALGEANQITYEGGVLRIKGPQTWLTYEPGYRKE